MPTVNFKFCSVFYVTFPKGIRNLYNCGKKWSAGGHCCLVSMVCGRSWESSRVCELLLCGFAEYRIAESFLVLLLSPRTPPWETLGVQRLLSLWMVWPQIHVAFSVPAYCHSGEGTPGARHSLQCGLASSCSVAICLSTPPSISVIPFSHGQFLIPTVGDIETLLFALIVSTAPWVRFVLPHMQNVLTPLQDHH